MGTNESRNIPFLLLSNRIIQVEHQLWLDYLVIKLSSPGYRTTGKCRSSAVDCLVHPKQLLLCEQSG